jgi:hypothetical protein
VKRVSGDVRRIKLVQVTTWEESSENVSDWSVYSVKLVFDDDPTSSDKLKQYRFVTHTLKPDLPMKVAAAISSFNPGEEFFKETDDWFGNVAKRFDKRFH